MKIKIGDILIWKPHSIAVKVTGKAKNCHCDKCFNLATTRNPNWGDIWTDINNTNLREYKRATKKNIAALNDVEDFIEDVKELNEMYP